MEMLGLINKSFYKKLFKHIFSDTVELTLWDGEKVTYGEGAPVFKIQLKEPLSKSKLLDNPSLTFGEAYMDRKIEIEGNLKQIVYSLYNKQDTFFPVGPMFTPFIKKRPNTTKRSKTNATFHYDIGNDFYQLWLDDTLTYSCAYFKTPTDSLTRAQQQKVDHILKKLCLTSNHRLLDIGCGWGNLILTAAKQYGVKATGITLSNEQYARVKERIQEEQLEHLVDVRLMDYRDLQGDQFDRIVSVGMLEHAGMVNLSTYFKKVNELLIDGGLSVLHTITTHKQGTSNAWMDKYIFPGGYVPSVIELIALIADYDFLLIDLESLRRHYEKTLDCWAANFEHALEEVRKTKDERFIRMWRLYLNSCAASFQVGNIDLTQFVFTKGTNNELPMTRDYLYD